MVKPQVVVGLIMLLFVLLLDGSSLAMVLFVKIRELTWYSKSKYVFLAAILQHLPSDEVHKRFVFSDYIQLLQAFHTSRT